MKARFIVAPKRHSVQIDGDFELGIGNYSVSVTGRAQFSDGKRYYFKWTTGTSIFSVSLQYRDGWKNAGDVSKTKARALLEALIEWELYWERWDE